MNRRPAMPASLFGAVLGVSGLANDWRVGAALWRLPAWPGERLAGLASVVWGLCVAGYVAKWLWSRQELRDELNHPIQCCFVALVPVSTMLIALTVLPYSRGMAVTLYLVGAIAAVAFSVWRQGALLKGARDLNLATPVLYLPSVAANFVAAIVAGALGWQVAAQGFLGAGILSWLAIESVLLHRFFHAETMAKSIRGTLGIQLAPPAVGLVALLAASDSAPPLVASMLLGYGVLQVLIAARLLPWVLEGGFGASFWSFTFGVTALALGAERLAMNDHVLASLLAPWLFALANAVVGAVAVRSVWLLTQGRLIPSPTTQVAGNAP